MKFLDITGDYLEFLMPFKQGISGVCLVSDCSNGRFPQHGPNPLEAETGDRLEFRKEELISLIFNEQVGGTK